MKLELHKEKSKILFLSNGIDFVGFRNFYYFNIPRKRNIRNMLSKIKNYKDGKLNKDKILESFQGWNAYAKWANSLKIRRKIVKEIYAKNK